MANRRMFSRKITSSSEFLMMSPSAQSLYFHVGMNADDDGICEVFPVMRMTDSKPDDLRALHEKGFVHVVDSKVLFIKDWHENNFIRNDRYTKSEYLKRPEYAHIKEAYDSIVLRKTATLLDTLPDNASGIPVVYQSATEVRIGQDRVGEEKKDDVASKYLSNPPKEDMDYFKSRFHITDKEILDKCEDLLNYCRMHKKYYKSYRAFLLNALKGDFKGRAVLADIKSLGAKMNIGHRP